MSQSNQSYQSNQPGQSNRSSQYDRVIRPAAALVVLGIILLLVMGWWSDYKTPDAVDVGETTSTVEATATPDGEDAEAPAEGEAAESEEAASQGTVTVLVNGLNFRKEPSSDSDLIRGLAADSKLDFLGNEAGWYKVRDADGTVGYVSSSAQYTRLEQ